MPLTSPAGPHDLSHAAILDIYPPSPPISSLNSPLSLSLSKMQQAIPYGSGRTWFPAMAASNGAVRATVGDRPRLDRPSTSSSSEGGRGGGGGGGGGGMRRLVAENPVLVVGRRGCCMCHVVKHLLLGLGVNPAVCEVAEDAEKAAVEELAEIAAAGGGVGQQVLFPAVFIGGRLVGGLDRLMAVHISGDLVPILKEAGALWL